MNLSVTFIRRKEVHYPYNRIKVVVEYLDDGYGVIRYTCFYKVKAWFGWTWKRAYRTHSFDLTSEDKEFMIGFCPHARSFGVSSNLRRARKK